MGAVSAEQPPSWLVAWRERQGLPRVPAQPQPRPSPAGRPRTAHARGTDRQGFSEPAAWPDDGGARREPVLDYDHNPPRLVRRVGWRRCLRCRRSFFSDDVAGRRLCGDCRCDSDRYAK